MVKKGDTLIEVAIAIGIFSMIAIAITSVMSSGISNAQSALETTLAREEIDTQAEALRFIQSAYIADKGINEDSPYVKLWRTITGNALTLNSNSDTSNSILQYAPQSCSSLYNDGIISSQKAFILDPNKLGDFTNPKEVYFSTNNASGKFSRASTYPRLVYGRDASNQLTDNSASAFFQAEGIYVIAVKDQNTTQIVNKDEPQSAFYDFYIRTCWYSTDSEEPSTISTVMRLYDPDAIEGSVGLDGRIQIVYNNLFNGNNAAQPKDKLYIGNATSSTPAALGYSRVGYTFKGWCDEAPQGDTCPGELQPSFEFTNSDSKNQLTKNLWAMYEPIVYTVRLNPTSQGSLGSTPATQTCSYAQRNSCPANSGAAPTRTGYKFAGWCDGTAVGDSCSGRTYANGANLQGLPDDRSATVNLTAMWRENNETIKIELTWSSSIDYDSYIVGTKSNNQSFTAWYGELKPTETVSGVTRVLASIDHDCTGGCRNETSIINTLGGKNYYYYVRNYTSNSNVTGATVKISSESLGTITYSSNNASGSGRIWNVFAYKDGRLVPRNTRSSTAETSY